MGNNCEIINIYEKQYMKTIYNGETVLKKYNEKYKMWVTLSFSPTENIDNIKQITKSCMIAK